MKKHSLDSQNLDIVEGLNFGLLTRLPEKLEIHFQSASESALIVQSIGGYMPSQNKNL